ncbi:MULTISPECIES: NYN domain-containing protein [Clostridium]|uniref:NYN domain-containing protein n=1 Tax=Clostridium cibarium TaxID=2762247 RepID=A0ABR8PUR9_9CLOT|nr:MULTISPECIES: NYN domain-containing protein [Clostridium]MBD7911909.1 NYN domain-containing protein [Clostridium cibarium]
MEEKRFAVLIDADNVSSKYIKNILDEISNYGIATYKRIYGDWTSKNAAGWKEVLLENSISPIQQYSYTTGKNATDSAMIIDAMDILYSNSVEGFCIVSSDSDFTKLAVRLRESGMIVIGMGEEKTPKPFSVACNIFKYLDILSEVEEQDTIENSAVKSKEDKEKDENNKLEIKAKEAKTMTDIKIIEESIIKIITENGNELKGMDMGELGSRLVKRYPDFDVRNYGYSKLSKFITSFNSLDLETELNNLTVRVKTNDVNLKTIENTVIKIIKENGEKGINMGELNQKLVENYPNFNVRNYGYSKFSKLINELNEVTIKSKGRNGCAKTVTLLKNVLKK